MCSNPYDVVVVKLEAEGISTDCKRHVAIATKFRYNSVGLSAKQSVDRLTQILNRKMKRLKDCQYLFFNGTIQSFCVNCGNKLITEIDVELDYETILEWFPYLSQFEGFIAWTENTFLQRLSELGRSQHRFFHISNLPRSLS